MSATQGVRYSTQIGPYPPPDQEPVDTQIQILNVDRMNKQHVDLLNDAKNILTNYAPVAVITVPEIQNLSPVVHLFVVPYIRDDFVKRIQMHESKLNPDKLDRDMPEVKRRKRREIRIMTARAVIEAVKYRGTQVPPRTIAMSLSMYKCRVYLVKALYSSCKNKINEMCGTVVYFDDPDLNVVVANKADNKYCALARQRNIPVVSIDWVEEAYSISKSEEEAHINHNASATIPHYQIKPFHELIFKIKIPELTQPLKTLIKENDGKVAYGNVETTHVVCKEYPAVDKQTISTKEPRIVDVEFLETCVRVGHYMTQEEYRAHLKGLGATVKQEILSQAQDMRNEIVLNPNNCFTPPNPNARSTLSSIKSNGFENRFSQDNQMLPPVSGALRQTSRKPHINDIILESLDNLSGPQQTQMPSTQLRRLPEKEIKYERICEPSQQLYWNDNCTKRH